MFVFPLNLIGDIFNFIAHGTIAGLPTLLVMAVPFIIGLILGFLVKKLLKWAIIALVVVFILAYFGIWGLNFDKLQSWAFTYGGLAVHEAILLIAILPLGLGFVIGLIVGFIFG